MRTQVLFSTLLALVVSIGIVGCGSENTTQSDADFLESVRTSDAAATPSTPQTGLIDPSSEGNPPTIVLESSEFDMGLIPTTEKTYRDFKVFNHGDQPLTISNISTECPCTKGEMVNDTIPAGGVETMRIQLDPEIVPLYHSSKKLTIASNDPVHPRVQLTVIAKLEGELIQSDETITFPETLAVGNGASQSIRITQTSTTPLQNVEGLLQGAPEGMTFAVTLVPEAERAKPEFPEWLATITIAPETKSGNYKPIARINYNDGRQRPRNLNIPVRVNIKGIYAFEPQEITLRNVIPGEVYEGITTLSAEVPFTVDSVKSLNPAFNVTHVPGQEPNTVVFNLDIPETPDNRLQKDEWTIEMTVDGKPVTETVKVVALMAR